MIWKIYEKPCVISIDFNYSMISKCSGMLHCGQTSFNVSWSGVQKSEKPCAILTFSIWLSIRSGRQMGAICNIQINRKIKIVDISLDQRKKRFFENRTKSMHCDNMGALFNQQSKKCWYFIRPKQKNDSLKSMHPVNFGPMCTCLRGVSPELLKNHLFCNKTDATWSARLRMQNDREKCQRYTEPGGDFEVFWY